MDSILPLADVPLRIEAVDDDFVVDESAWTIAMDEEETVLLSLTTFASDIDGDALTWTIESNRDSKVVAALSGQELLITARLDEWGTDTGWWLNVSDGSTTFSKELNVSIAPQPDRPTLSNASVERTGSTNLQISWMWSDSDGDAMDVIIQIDGDEKLGERACDAQDVCSERFEMDLQPGSTVNIDIIARDSSFSDVSTRLQYIVPDEESTSTTGDNSESESGGTLVAAIIIVPLLAVIGWLLFQFKNPLKSLNKRHPQVVYWPVQRQPSTNHNGIFPCFLGGLHSRFERRIARARQSRRRLSVGSITSSSQPFLAATYGSPNLALYSATNR